MMPAMMLTPQTLPFQQVQHKVLTLDAQPASASIAAILVLVTGQLLVDGGQNVLPYSQMFHVRHLNHLNAIIRLKCIAGARRSGILCAE